MARLVSEQLQQDEAERFIVEQTTASTAAAPAPAAATVGVFGIEATMAETVREGEAAMAVPVAAMAAVREGGESHGSIFHMCHDALRYIL